MLGWRRAGPIRRYEDEVADWTKNSPTLLSLRHHMGASVMSRSQGITVLYQLFSLLFSSISFKSSPGRDCLSTVTVRCNAMVSSERKREALPLEKKVKIIVKIKGELWKKERLL